MNTSARSSYDADRIRSAKFTTSFRGFDVVEVKAHLDAVATGYEGLLASEALLRSELAKALTVSHEPAVVAALSAAEGAFDDGQQLDGESTRMVAEQEAQQVLEAARTEAAEIVGRANDEAARIILRARAESRGRPSSETIAVLEAASPEIHDVDTAKEQARLMISEAKAVRERILTDLSKRRRVAHVQLEQMRVAREKLVESLRDARRLVDEASRDLSTAEVEARIAAESAGRRVESEPLVTAHELEAELLTSGFVRSARGAESPAPVVAGSDATAAPTEHDSTPAGALSQTEGPEPAPPVGLSTPAAASDESLLILADDAAGSLASDPSVEESSSVAVVTRREVDDLFARLRAAREVDTAQARMILAAEVTNTDSGVLIDLTVTDRLADADASVSAAVGAIPIGVIDAESVAEIQPTEPTHVGEFANFELATPSPNDGGQGAPLLRLVPPIETAASIVAPAADSTGSTAASMADGRTDESHEYEEDPQYTYVSTRLQSKLTRALKRELQDEQSAALTAVRTSRSRLDLDGLLGPIDVHERRLLDIVAPTLNDAARAGADNVGRALSGDSGLDSLASEVVLAIVGPLRDEVRVEVERVAEPTTDASEFVDLVSRCYRRWTVERLTAATEPALLQAYRLGRTG